MKKRILSMLLAIVMVAGLVPGFAITASAADTSGTCGDTATWSFDSTSGTLTISGTGAISDYASAKIYGVVAPWFDYKSQITKIVIADGITAIGECAFYGCKITEIDIPLSVMSIGSNAFNSCSNLVYASHNADATLGSTNPFPSSFPGIFGYKITFDDNDPTTPNRIVKVKSSNTIQEPSSPKVGENGFVGWYKDEELTDPVSFPYSPANSTETCYGKWENTVVELEGPFTVKPLNENNTIELKKDYFWENNILSITTDIPVVVGMKDGVTTTSDQIHIKEVNADVTLDNVTIEIPSTQVTKKALYIEKCASVTLRIEGTTTIKNLSMSGTTRYGYGIEIYTEDYAESEVTITGNGTLNIEASAWALTDSGKTTSSVIFDTVTANLKSHSSPSAETMTIQNGATVKIESNTGNNFGVIPSNTVLTVAPTDGKLYRIDSGVSASDTTSQYVMDESEVVVYNHYYFYAEEIDTVPILSASASIDAPEKNGAPDTTADIPSGANYTASAVTWNGDPAEFLGGTEYTATFTLIPAAGYAFVSDTAVTVDGAEIVGKTLNNDGSLTVNAKFPATEAAVPVSIAVKTAPSDVEYIYGDEFNPAGLVITITNDDGTTQDVAYNDATKDNFSFAPMELTVATTKITVTYADKTAEIDITVVKKPVTAPENAGSKQFTGNTLTAVVDVTNEPYTVTTNEGGINVGEYDVVLVLTDPDNYKWSDSEDAEKTIKFNIIQADALTLNGTATMVKNHANHTVEIDLTTISGYPANPGGTPAFAITSGDNYNGLTSITLDGSKLILVADKTNNDISDTVTISVTGMENYADTTTITIAVSYTDKTVVTITGVSAVEGLKYSGTQQNGYTGIPSSEYTGEYVITYAGTDKAGNNYGPSAEAPVNAGDYSLTFAVPDSNTEYAGSITINFTIGKAAATVTADDKEAYVGSRMPELTYKVVGLIGNDIDTINVQLSCDANMNRIGETPIVVTATDPNGNYEITTVNGTLTVKMIYIPIIPSNPTYPPIVDDSENGDVDVTPKNPEKGDTVVITPDPDTGYEVDEIIVTDKNGNPVTAIDNGDGTYSFKQPSGKVNIEVTFKEIIKVCPGDWTCPMYGYDDLDMTAWYHDGVHFCIEHGLMQGVGSNEFAPNGTTTRAMIVTILWRLEGSPDMRDAQWFEDVPVGQWYSDAIAWAAFNGIVDGYGNGKFGTNDPITREQFVTIMFRYAKYKGYDVSVSENTNILSYDDAFDVAEWAIPAMQWACGEGLVKGIADGSKMNLAPQGNATRAQAAAILQRFIENVVNEK